MTFEGKIQTLAEHISSAQNICVVSHSHPDGDAVGSCVAAYHFLKSCGKSVRILLEGPWPAAVDFLITPDMADDVILYTHKPETAANEAAASDHILFLDLNNISRTGSMSGIFSGTGAYKILIDHHLAPQEAEFNLIFSETQVSSACEFLQSILLKLPQTGGKVTGLPAPTVTALLTGITTDSNNFANSVFPGTLGSVSALLDAGADREDILDHIYNSYDERRFRLMGFLLGERMIITDAGVAIMVLDESTSSRFGIEQGDTEGFVNIPLGIKRVRMSILSKEEGDEFRVSIRSKRGISANRAAGLYFNGGGHEQAAGGKLYKRDGFSDYMDVTSYIIDVTGKFLENEK